MKPIILVIIDNPADEFYFIPLKKKFSFIFYHMNVKESPQKQAKKITRELHSKGVMPNGVFGGRDFPSILASLVADTLHLPGLRPDVLYKAQHKGVFTHIAAQVNPSYPYTQIITQPFDTVHSAIFPAFIKPVRGHISMNSYALDSKEAYHNIIADLFKRKNIVAEWFSLFCKQFKTPEQPPLNAFLLQPFIDARQYTVDGFVYKGTMQILGITESIYTADRKSFDRFEFPVILSIKASQKLHDILSQLISVIEYNNSGFNVEFFVTTDDNIILIELNTRPALQFVPLLQQWYEQNYIEILLNVCIGRKPQVWFRKKRRMAINFVFRSKKDKYVVSLPSEKIIDELKEKEFLQHLHIYVKKGDKLSDYDQDAYTYRYAVVDIIGETHKEIYQKYEIVKKTLEFNFRDLNKLHLQNVFQEKNFKKTRRPAFIYHL